MLDSIAHPAGRRTAAFPRVFPLVAAAMAAILVPATEIVAQANADAREALRASSSWSARPGPGFRPQRSAPAWNS